MFRRSKSSISKPPRTAITETSNRKEASKFTELDSEAQVKSPSS